MSRKLEDLIPSVRFKAETLLAACAREGILLMVTQTYRTYQEQAALYAKGRTAAGPAVTNAPPGYSWHNFRRAFDVAEKDKTPYDLGEPGPRDDAHRQPTGEPRGAGPAVGHGAAHLCDDEAARAAPVLLAVGIGDAEHVAGTL